MQIDFNTWVEDYLPITNIHQEKGDSISRLLFRPTDIDLRKVQSFPKENIWTFKQRSREQAFIYPGFVPVNNKPDKYSYTIHGYFICINPWTQNMYGAFSVMPK